MSLPECTLALPLPGVQATNNHCLIYCNNLLTALLASLVPVPAWPSHDRLFWKGKSGHVSVLSSKLPSASSDFTQNRSQSLSLKKNVLSQSLWNGLRGPAVICSWPHNSVTSPLKLYPCCSFCLLLFPADFHMTHSLSSFRSVLKCHLITQASLTTPIKLRARPLPQLFLSPNPFPSVALTHVFISFLLRRQGYLLCFLVCSQHFIQCAWCVLEI